MDKGVDWGGGIEVDWGSEVWGMVLILFYIWPGRLGDGL